MVPRLKGSDFFCFFFIIFFFFAIDCWINTHRIQHLNPRTLNIHVASSMMDLPGLKELSSQIRTLVIIFLRRLMLETNVDSEKTHFFIKFLQFSYSWAMDHHYPIANISIIYQITSMPFIHVIYYNSLPAGLCYYNSRLGNCDWASQVHIHSLFIQTKKYNVAWYMK